jgi:hypothetical protein
MPETDHMLNCPFRHLGEILPGGRPINDWIVGESGGVIFVGDDGPITLIYCPTCGNSLLKPSSPVLSGYHCECRRIEALIAERPRLIKTTPQGFVLFSEMISLVLRHCIFCGGKLEKDAIESK